MKFGGKRQSPLCFLESGMVLCYTVHKSTAAEVSVRKKIAAGKKALGRSGRTALANAAEHFVKGRLNNRRVQL